MEIEKRSKLINDVASGSLKITKRKLKLYNHFNKTDYKIEDVLFIDKVGGKINFQIPPITSDMYFCFKKYHDDDNRFKFILKEYKEFRDWVYDILDKMVVYSDYKFPDYNMCYSVENEFVLYYDKKTKKIYLRHAGIYSIFTLNYYVNGTDNFLKHLFNDYYNISVNSIEHVEHEKYEKGFDNFINKDSVHIVDYPQWSL